MTETTQQQAIQGDGYAVTNLSDLGDGYGFRKIRKALGVTAFGVNALVFPPSYEASSHYHEEQEELYFLHRGRIAIKFDDGSTHELEAGGLARVDASTVRQIRNLSDSEDAVFVVVGRDGKLPEGEDIERVAQDHAISREGETHR
jgi:mannose-6-phosphate isomerase-like protein (cupin superfamily)